MERTASRRDSELVRQTAELLSIGGSLSDIFERFCLLLAQFVDASVVFIALESEDGVHIEFIYDHGLSVRDAHVPIRPESQTFRVMHTGESLLMRDPEDLPAYPVPIQIPGSGDEDAASAIFVPLRFGSRPIGVLSVQSPKPRAYDEYDVQLLETCALYVAAQNTRAPADSTIDTVTGVGTRRLFDERLNRDWTRALRAGTSVALILMDVDRFKTFNGTYGHIAGDSCLAQVAQAARSCVARSSDLFTRYGGEAFAAVLCDVPAKAAVEIAQRMRSAVRALQIPHEDNPSGFVTASFGVACSAAVSDDPRPLLRRAERALFAAKTAGRDRVVLDAPARLDESPQLGGNLPPVNAETIGRRIELDALARSLALSRLTTVVGPAGAGKTHCALAVAHQLAQAYVHGAWFFDVSLARDEHELDAVLCAGIDSRLVAHRHPRDAIMRYFAYKHCLIVLDHCERDGSQVSALCAALLARAQRATILATSRLPLKLPRERVFHLSALTRNDAEALFCAHAGAALPGGIFDAQDRAQIRGVCETLGDVPLSIELAARRADAVSPAQLSSMLCGRRHAVEDVIAWSYRLLDERAQRLFERLSVFADAFDADAARDVCGFSPLRPGEAAAAFDELVEQYLVSRALIANERRYRLPDPVRAAAAQLVRERGEHALMCERHARYYLECAQRLSGQIAGDGGIRALEAATREWAQFRAVLERCFADEAQHGIACALVLALTEWWIQTRRIGEARGWIDRALESSAAMDWRRIDLLSAAVRVAEADGDFTVVREHASHMLALAESSEERTKLGRACNALGNAERHLGNGKAAAQWYTSALAHYRACGEERGIGLVLLDLGRAAADLDLDFTRARDCFFEALERFQQLGHTFDAGVALANLGAIAAQTSDYETAISYASQSLAVFERLSDPCAQAWQLVSIAHYRIERQEWERAAAALRNAHAILQEHPHREYAALLLEVGLYLAGDLKRDELTARIAGYLHAYRERERVPRLPSAQRHYDGRVQRSRRRLGTHAFEEAYASGAACAPDALLAEVVRA